MHSTRAIADSGAPAKLWQILGTGLEKFELEVWRQKKIPVANTRGQFGPDSLDQCAMMIILMLARHWQETQLNLRESRIYSPMGKELGGARLILLSIGASA
ncbi:MAG: hypothetical protein HY508_04615 [Acidobacteria bacterium]|nr:hypothetical protein [Acidobacteriota bacterium]